MVDLGANLLLAKDGHVGAAAAALVGELLVVTVPERLGWAGLRAPWLEVLGRAVVAQIALLHQPRLGIHLGYAEGAGIDAVAAANAARGIGHLHHPVRCDLNRHNRTDLRAGRDWVGAVHANGRLGGDAPRAVDKVNHYHALALVRVALAAGRIARPSADAARWVDE